MTIEISLLALAFFLVFYIFRFKKQTRLRQSYDVLSDIMGSFEHMILKGQLFDYPPAFQFQSMKMFDEVLCDIRMVAEKYKYTYHPGECHLRLSKFSISKKDTKLFFKLHCMPARSGSSPSAPLLYFLIAK